VHDKSCCRIYQELRPKKKNDIIGTCNLQFELFLLGDQMVAMKMVGIKWLGSNGWDPMVGIKWLGSNGWDQMVAIKWLGSNGWDQMVGIKWHDMRILAHTHTHAH
jgi:hypothetical protein